MQTKKTHAFSEIEQYREYLEIKNLRGKNYIVSGVFFVMLILTVGYMILTGYTIALIIPVALGYLFLLIINFVLSAYGDSEYSYLKMNKYISTLGMFSIATAMIMFFQSPSFVPLLFVAYCVCAIYQDLKVLIISDIYFIVAIILTVVNYPELLLVQNSTNGSNFSITLFSILFLMMLSISAYIIMKEKSFFYNQIAKSKELEYRNIRLLIDLKHQTNKDNKNFMDYYDHTNEFLKAFSEKIELPNIFEEKIAILKDLEANIKDEKILEMYSDYDQEDLNRLRKLLISNQNILAKISVKINKSREASIKKREIFSATHFKSFNKQSDTIEVKILAFVIFYVSLKKGLLGMKKLTNEEILYTITETDYFYYIDSEVMKIYQENSEVFDAIISDAFGKGGRS